MNASYEDVRAVAAAVLRHRLVLDTETGSPAEEVYERLGWTRVGTIPDYALTSSGELCGSTFFTKSLVSRT